MLTDSKIQAQQDLFKRPLSDLINPKHELLALSESLDWKAIELHFAKLYARNFGAPAKPLRLMCGLILLKHLEQLSDEELIRQWVSNPYYQAFCGEKYFHWNPPCASSELTHFRKRIGGDGAAFMLTQTLVLHKETLQKENTVLVDTTVQEADITYPTDAKIAGAALEKLRALAKDVGLPLRRSYKRTQQALLTEIRFLNHPKHLKKKKKLVNRLKTATGSLLRDVKRKIDQANITISERQQELLTVIARSINQPAAGPEKVYSLHEPDTVCIAKGKLAKKYEFGKKVGLAVTAESKIVLSVDVFEGNPHDGKTLEKCMSSAVKNLGRAPQSVGVDRGYRGHSYTGNTQIIIPNPKKDSVLSQAEKAFRSAICKKRAGIEPIIGHLKHECGMLRNYLKGHRGHVINANMAAAAWNLKQWIRRYRETIKKYLFWLFNADGFMPICYSKVA
jgi:IS5 family transposase